MIEMKPLREKELKKMVKYRKRLTWDTSGCFNCKYSHEDAIRKGSNDKCGLHEFVFHRNFKCETWEARKI